MAYATSGLKLGVSLLGGAYRIWVYQSTDPFSTVDDTGYFTDATARGMQEGDIVIVSDTDSDPPDITLSYCSVINATTGVGTVVAMVAGSAPSVTSLTASSATINTSAMIASAAAGLVGFYGKAGVSQRASSVQATSNVASSTDFAAGQLAVLHEIMTTLTGVGLWKGTA